MSKIIPLSRWAEANCLTRHQAFNLVRAGKVTGAEIRQVTIRRWFVPADARPDLSDRRKKDVGRRESPIARSA